MQSLAQLQSDLARGGKSRNLVEQCLARIADQSGEGRRAFLKVHAEEALAAARQRHSQRIAGAARQHELQARSQARRERIQRELAAAEAAALKALEYNPDQETARKLLSEIRASRVP